MFLLQLLDYSRQICHEVPPRVGILTEGTILGTAHGTAQSHWSNSQCGSVVVRFATFGAGDVGVRSSRFFGIMFCDLFGVMLIHLFKEGCENMATTFA
jgi:hypothetical protein